MYACIYIYVCIYKNCGLLEVKYECYLRLYSSPMLCSMHMHFNATKANRTELALTELC